MSIEYDNKVKNYYSMYENETKYIVATPTDWIRFLHTSCNNYKLDFRELVLVNTTYPNATALLPLKDWNKKFGRKVKKSESGIPSLEFGKNNRLKLKYYFDISQTSETQNSKPVPMWAYDKKYEKSVVTALNSEFGLSGKNFETAVAGAINKFNSTNLDKNYKHLQNEYGKTSIEKFGATAKKIYCEMIAKSAMAVICARCGYDITRLFHPEEFQDVTYFDSTRATVALGQATLETAKSVLRVISYTIFKEKEKENTYGREKENSQRNRLYTGRGRDLVSGLGTSAAGAELLGNNEEGLPQGERPGRVRNADDNRRDVTAPRQNSDAGSGNDGYSYRAEEKGTGRERGAEGEGLAQIRSDGNQHSGGSPSDSIKRADIHLSENRINDNQKAEETDNSSAFSVSQEDIYSVLSEGSITSNSKYRIYEQFQKNETLESNAKFLSQEYGVGGISPTLTVSYLSLFSDSKGIRLTNSRNGAKQLINWKKAAVIISNLINADRYFNSAEKSGYIEYKSQKAAKSSTAENKALKVSNENRQAHYKVGDKCYIGADEYKITDISENTVTLYDDRFPLLSKDMSRAEFERKISENTFNEHLFGAENTVIDKDLFFYNPDSEQITYMYYNPDADSGGQLVITNISYEEIIEASQRYSDNTSEFFDYIVSVGRQTAVDIDSEFFRDSLDKYNSNSHFAESLTDDVKNQLTNIALSADTNFNQNGYYDSYSEIQSEHPDAIILFRVGDFYEVLGENAQEAAEALNLTLMSRTINGEKIPMVGFPSSYLEDNENLLVENGHKIVTVEPEDIAERASLRNKAQEFAQQNDLPFSDKFSKGAEDDFDTAVYDGSMSADDYEKLKQTESHLASAYEYKIADINNIGNILRKQFASDEIIDIAYAFGISNSSWFKDAHPRDTHENVTKRELRDIDSSVIIDGIKVKINTTDTGVVFSSVNAEYSYSWQEVADSFYSAVLNYTLDGMYSEIIAEAQDNKASVSTFNNVLSSEEYPIQNAREIKISNEYIQLAEDGKGYNLIGDIENGANENKGVIIKNFADEKELVDYLKDKKYLLNGYGINTAIFETESQNTPAIEPKFDRPTITCVWSEHPAFENGRTYSVADFDIRMKNSDAEWIKLRQQELDNYGNDMKAMYQAYENGEIDGVHQGYAKVKFTVNMPNGTQYTERQDIGDGDGGVIDFLRKAPGYKNIIPILEKAINDEPSLLTPVYGEAFADEVLKSDNLSTKVPTEKETENIFLSSEGNNYAISDDSFADGTKTERYANNIKAIKTLKQLQQENRNATQAEQEILAKYVGWGGLDSYFKDENNAELKALLTDEEYKAAKASTLTSFYTPPAVIRAIYKTLNNLGFNTGNILEPSCGVGNFMGLIPQDMSDSKFYGVELDTISGNIASKLYPKANIAVQGYETTKLPDNFFDVAVGNVPFAQIKVLDKKYDKHNFLIHDYFFAKTLDKVRPGGIVAFVTSRGTMDKKSNKVRKYIAQRAELLGAIRLPNNTFSRTAGTEVTSDILILKKRERMVDIEPEWVHLDKDDNGIVMNSYFVKHPEMILGEMKEVSGPHGLKPECIAYDNARLEDLLDEAVSNINGEYKAQEIETELDSTTDDEELTIPAIPGVRNFSYTVVDGDIYYRTNSIMKKSVFSKTAEERVKGLIQVRDAVREVLDNQLEDMSDEDIKNAQVRLNRIYDNFIKKYGYINSKANMNAFKEDSAIQLVASLEEFDSEKNYKGKADIFSKRTIKPHKAVSSVDTAADALAVSIAEKAKVDLEYMSKLYNKPAEEIISELEGAIFNVPGTDEYQTADEYLSGNVREKLREALSYSYNNPEKYDSNITALKAVQPADLTASEIDVRLGATWLPTEVVRDFIFETLSTPYYMRASINVLYSKYNSEWRITNKNFDKSVNAQNTYGTKRISAYKIIEDTLNLRDVKIFDTIYEDGKEKRVLNKSETAIAQSKQEMIKNRFSGWIFADRDRRERLCRIYNEKFNSIRPREYDGSFLVLEGMSNEIKLREHQLNAVAHAVYGGNTLLAHTVGAGKTFEMVAIAMESKRLGLCNKSLFVVPNHITEQFGIEFLQLYPAANILVATKKDFETQNRKKFCSRIATGDYDAVIIGHSQFEKIPMSIERQRQIIEMQIDEVINSIADAKNNNAENFTIKQLAKTQKNLEIRLEKLNDQSRKDDVVTFEELGVDRLFVDEAHYYKNLFLYTKMRNVAGIGQSEAQKSSDLFMKCRYLDELTEGKGVIFATGTPISNSMTELYTMQRYLQYNKLLEQGLNNFDAWASTYGETVTALELSPEGNGYRAKTRFAKFFNLPELMSSFREIADIKTADVLNLDVPKAERHNVLTKPSEQQKQILEGLADRAEKVRSNKVDPSTDNMLKITNDGRKLALDQRLINPMLPDDENSKLNACADNIFSLWDKTKADRLAQMVFCDISTPNGSGDFNVYDDLKDKLIKKGIPENEISFIHDAKTNIQKQDMFSKVRNGDIRVIIGSTSKMGAGTNCQDKLIALHHLDCPWRPADLQQREGRIVRQGNKNPVVQIFSYVTENTFDAYLYQLVENKQKFISQIMTSKSPVRSAEDIDETALSYSEIKALASGNPLIKEKMDLDVEVAKLRLLKANFLSVKYELEDKIASMYPLKISSINYNIEKIEDDIKLAESHSDDEDFSLTLRGVTYTDKKEAGKQLLFACDKSVGSEKVRIGEYKGFILDLRFDSYHSNNYILTLNGKAHYDVELGMDTFGNITRMDNLIKSLPDRLQRVQNELINAENDLKAAQEEVNKTFDREDELNSKNARLKELNGILEMDNLSGNENSNSDDEYLFVKVDEKQKDILSSAGYKEFSPSDDKGKFICKFPADEKDKVQKLISNNNNLKI